MTLCPICFESYNADTRRAKNLPCGHSVCCSCLQSLLDISKNQCPLDRLPFGDNIKNAKDFPNCEIISFINQESEEKNQNEDFCTEHKKSKEYVVYPETKKVCKKCLTQGNYKGRDYVSLEKIKIEKKFKREKLKNQINKFNQGVKELNFQLKQAENSMQEEITKKFGNAQHNLKRQGMQEWANIGLGFTAKKLKTDSELSSDKKLRDELEKKMFDLEDEKNLDQDLLKEEDSQLRIPNQDQQLSSLQHIHLENLDNIFVKIQELTNSFYGNKTSFGGAIQEEIISSDNQTPFEKNLQTIKTLIQIEKVPGVAERIIIKPREWSLNGNLPTDILESPESWKNCKNVTISFCKDRIREDVLQAIFIVYNELTQAIDLKLALSNPKLTDNEILLLFERDFWSTPQLKIFELDVQKCTFSDATFKKIVSGTTQNMPNLTNFHLHLTETKISDQTLEAFGIHTLSHLKNLHTFTLGIFACPNITSNGLVALAYFLKNPLRNVQVLNLHIGGNIFSNAAINYLSLEVFSQLMNLEQFHISLTKTEFNDDGIQQFCKALTGKVQNLKKMTLLLNDSKVTDQGVEEMSKVLIPQLSQAQDFIFSLYRTRISDKSFKILFESMKNYMTKLDSLLLNFGSTQISDVSINQYADENIQAMKDVKNFKFYLHETAISDKSIVNLGNKVQGVLSNIQNLCFGLCSTEVTNDSAETLKKILEKAKSLQGFHVYFENTRVGSNKIREISSLQQSRGVRILS